VGDQKPDEPYRVHIEGEGLEDFHAEGFKGGLT